jgi:hypothetical protein
MPRLASLPARRKQIVAAAVNPPRNRAPHPGASRVPAKLDTSTAARSVYVGRDRLGTYRRAGDTWVAEDRLGRPLGRFDTEIEAANAVSAARVRL